MDEIKKLKFVETIIIVAGKLFYNFVKKFNENLKKIYVLYLKLLFIRQILNLCLFQIQ